VYRLAAEKSCSPSESLHLRPPDDDRRISIAPHLPLDQIDALEAQAPVAQRLEKCISVGHIATHHIDDHEVIG
jgi:hypothetical protein